MLHRAPTAALRDLQGTNAYLVSPHPSQI